MSFFCHDTATTEIYTLSLHDALPICAQVASLFDHVDLDGNLLLRHDPWPGVPFVDGVQLPPDEPGLGVRDRKSTRLNSSHPSISYAVFCLKKKKKQQQKLHFKTH